MLYLLTIFFLVSMRILWLGAGVAAVCVLLGWLGVLSTISFWWPLGLGIAAIVSLLAASVCATIAYPPRGF